MYQRIRGKFDQIISYVGGLFGVVMPFVAWFLLSYNRYRYEIKVAEGAFNFDEDGKKIKEKDFNFFTYIKYTIYTWINTIFCTRIKWKNCNDIDKVREIVNSDMDVGRMFKRLQKIEQAVNYKIDKN